MPKRILPILAAASLLGLASFPASAQSVARRVQQAGSGAVRLSFAAQPDVCGDGENIVRFREDGRRDRVNYIRHRGGFSGTRRVDDEAWLGRCTFGPVVVTLSRSGGRVTDAEVRVGDADAERGATDLGRVPAQEAVDYLLRDALPSADRDAAKELILASVLADSAEFWPALLDVARDDRLPSDVRKNAVFWVGQAAAEKATAGLASIAGDAAEDLDVRRHALFALSQQPRDVGTPALIDVARTSREPELVKHALFWLGQSNDPRALELFKEILTRR
jgi:hypothetical protein